jgi:hypothetical protein
MSTGIFMFVPTDLLSPTKSKLYFTNSLATHFNEPAFDFWLPDLIDTFRCLGGVKESVQVRDPSWSFLTWRCSMMLLVPSKHLTWRNTPYRLATTAVIHIWKPKRTHLHSWIQFTKHKEKALLLLFSEINVFEASEAALRLESLRASVFFFIVFVL